MKKIVTLYRSIMNQLRNLQVPGFTYTTCKFHPSCSEYAELAIEKHGSAKGSVMALARIARCNPFSQGGIDYP